MGVKVIFFVMATICLTAWISLSGNPQGPGATPENTFTYTLDDLYNHLNSGAEGSWGLETDTALLTQVPATGQTQCWDNGGTLRDCVCTGEDGEHQRGASLPSPRFTINTDSTVTDNLTRLIWMPDANLMVTQNPTFDNDATVNDGRITWQHALEYVSSLNSAFYLEHNDWRMPNINELESLRDRRYVLPCVSNTNNTAKCSNSGDPFINAQTTNYYQ